MSTCASAGDSPPGSRLILQLGEEAGENLRSSDNLPPNASATQIAEHHDFMVVVTDQLPRPFEGILDYRDMLILARPKRTQAQTEQVVAHELGHHMLLNRLSGSDLEVAAWRAAAAAMMPARAFRASFRKVGRDPFRLHAHWPHCPPLALAFRQSDLFPNFVSSAWSGADRRRFRPHYGLNLPLFLDAVEKEALYEAYAAGRGMSRVQRYGLVTYAWRTSRWPQQAITITEIVRDLDGP